jgi:hypothetical protein
VFFLFLDSLALFVFVCLFVFVSTVVSNESTFTRNRMLLGFNVPHSFAGPKNHTAYQKMHAGELAKREHGQLGHR